MKLFNRYVHVSISVVFLGLLFFLYHGEPNNLVYWLLFPPVKIAKYMADTYLRLPPDSSIFYSLLVGTPATAVYFVWALSGFHKLVRR